MRVIDEFTDDITKLMEADFGPLSRTGDFNRTVLDWLTYKARCIPARPRAVLASPSVQAARGKYRAISALEQELREGASVQARLSDSIRRNPKKHKADMMFNDWQVSHFHLGTMFVSPRKAQRTEALLFAYIEPNRAILLDVLPHSPAPWSAQQLLRRLHETEPSVMERYELKGILPAKEERSDEELGQLRKANMATFVTLNGKVYMSPGFGIVSSGHPLRIGRGYNGFLRTMNDLIKRTEANDLSHPAVARFVRLIGVPVRLGVLFDVDHFVLVEKTRGLILHRGPSIC